MLKIFIRKVYLFPIFLTINILNAYQKCLSFFDPNGSERKLEEIFNSYIEKKINSNLKLNYKLDYHPRILKKKKINLYTPTKITSFRASTFFTKEKDTICWIDKFGKNNNVFFDIGANIGLYSLYYSSLYKSPVFSFEPDFQNLYLFKKNIILNKLQKFIKIVPNPVYNKYSFGSLIYDIKNLSGSSNIFFNDKKFINKKNFKKISILSIKIDDLTENSITPYPSLIKIDVDGSEIEVIKGAYKTITSKECVSVLVEVRNTTVKFIHNFFIKNNFRLLSNNNSNMIYLKNNLRYLE